LYSTSVFKTHTKIALKVLISNMNNIRVLLPSRWRYDTCAAQNYMITILARRPKLSYLRKYAFAESYLVRHPIFNHCHYRVTQGADIAARKITRWFNRHHWRHSHMTKTQKSKLFYTLCGSHILERRQEEPIRLAWLKIDNINNIMSYLRYDWKTGTFN